jgi:AcrR family transcriptional regulator
MRRVPVTERHSKERRAVRAGRPHRRLAGEVDARILDAARRLFFERGLDGTSMDGIACLARAGKRTIYARFPSKETLFAAVVLRALPIEHFESDAPTEASVEERLETVGVSILKWVLEPSV